MAKTVTTVNTIYGPMPASSISSVPRLHPLGRLTLRQRQKDLADSTSLLENSHYEGMLSVIQQIRHGVNDVSSRMNLGIAGQLVAADCVIPLHAIISHTLGDPVSAGLFQSNLTKLMFTVQSQKGRRLHSRLFSYQEQRHRSLLVVLLSSSLQLCRLFVCPSVQDSRHRRRPSPHRC